MRIPTTLAESLSLLFGNQTVSLDLQGSDLDDPQGEVWDEIGIAGAPARAGLHPRNEMDLDNARQVARLLSQDNGYAMAALEARQSYIVGTGLAWKLTPRDAGPRTAEGETEVDPVILEAGLVLEEFSERNEWPEFEQEFVLRADRDGEVFQRFTYGRDGVDVRFVEPEDVRDPKKTDKQRPFGVETAPGDATVATGFWVGDTLEPVRLPDKRPRLLLAKYNVVRNSLRGWPTLWAGRRNFVRAHRLLRNMSIVSALQAAIALIRRHETATSAEARSFVDGNADLLVTQSATGKQTYHQKWQPGTIVDHGPGVTYEAPVSSVKPESNIPIIQADLREIAAQWQMPEFMLTGSTAEASLATTLISEAPATKTFERLQRSRARPLSEGPRAALDLAVKAGRLPADLWTKYRLTYVAPRVISRNMLVEAQRHEIEKRNGVLSTRTWRSISGYDDTTEESNIAQEPKPQAEAPGANPSPGSRKDDEEVGVPRKD